MFKRGNGKKVVGGVLLLLAAAFYLFTFHIERNLVGGEEQSEFVIFVELPSGKKLGVSDKIVKEVEVVKEVKVEREQKPRVPLASNSADIIQKPQNQPTIEGKATKAEPMQDVSLDTTKTPDTGASIDNMLLKKK